MTYEEFEKQVSEPRPHSFSDHSSRYECSFIAFGRVTVPNDILAGGMDVDVMKVIKAEAAGNLWRKLRAEFRDEREMRHAYDRGYLDGRKDFGLSGLTQHWSLYDDHTEDIDRINMVEVYGKRYVEADDAVKQARQLLEENAKLRELVKGLMGHVMHPPCEGCMAEMNCDCSDLTQCDEWSFFEADAHRLGVEVDG